MMGNYNYPMSGCNQFSQPQLYNSFDMQKSLIRVTGIEGAKAYQMSPNSTVALFDSGSDVMYIKSTDGAGFPTIRTFRFEEIQNLGISNSDISTEKYVSKDEFEKFKQEVMNYGKQFISEQSNARGKNNSSSKSSTTSND